CGRNCTAPPATCARRSLNGGASSAALKAPTTRTVATWGILPRGRLLPCRLTRTGSAPEYAGPYTHHCQDRACRSKRRSNERASRAPKRKDNGMDDKIEARLATLGIVLPDAPNPVANYVPSFLAGNLLFVSGQVSKAADGSILKGRLGDNMAVA